MAEPVNKTAGYRLLSSLLLLTAATAFADNLPDPTRPSTMLGQKQEAGVVLPAAGPVLQSVLIAPGRRVAVISGQTVKPGDTFGQAQVVSISESEVVLRSGKDLQTLKLFPNVQKRLTSDSVRTPAEMHRQ